MAAKCNITNLVQTEIARVRWGIACQSAWKGIIENYIKYLNCDSVNIAPCYTDQICPPFSGASSFECNFNLIGISATLNPDIEGVDIIFDIKVTNYVGGKTPFTYLWEYDESDFDLIGELTDAQIKLKLKVGKVLTLLVTQIGITVTGADGCSDTKSCWLTPGGMQCSINYHACSNPVDLEIEYNYIPCSKGKSLVVITS